MQSSPSNPTRGVHLNIHSDGKRIAVILATLKHPAVMRIRSMPLHDFDFIETQQVFGVNANDAEIILIPINRVVLQRLQTVVQKKHYVRDLSEAPDHYITAFVQHMALDGVHDERVIFRAPRTLSPPMQRMLSRLGEVGYGIVAGQEVFARSRAANRVAAATFMAYKQWPMKHRLRDDLSKQLVSFNLVSQAFFALENFGAFFAALKSASDGDYAEFAKTYVLFGRTEKRLRRASILQTLDELSGKDADKIIGKVFQLPLSPPLIEKCGLEKCGVEPELIIESARFTRHFMTSAFKRLSRFMLTKEPVTGRPLRTAAAQAYGAFRHGFAVSIPVLGPRPTAISTETSFFSSDDAFQAYVEQADILGEFLYADESGKVQRISPPMDEYDLRPSLRTVYRCNAWINEFAKYAESLYGSVNGKFPYLINAVEVMGTERRAILQRRLDELEGRK